MTGTAFTLPSLEEASHWRELMQVVGALNGHTDWQRLFDLTGVTDNSSYVVTLQNQGTGGHLNIPNILSATNSGVTIPTLSVTTATVTTLTVSGVSTHNGNVVLGDAAGDTITVNGTPTFNTAVTFSNNVTVLGNTVLGNADTDTLTVLGLTTFRNTAASATQMFVDAGNNRVLVGSATNLSSASSSALEVIGNRTYLAPNSESLALGLRFGPAVTGQVYLGASNSATPDLIVSNNAGTQLYRAFTAGGLLIGTNTALAGSQLLEVQSGGIRVTAGGVLVTAGGLTVSAGGTTVTGDSTYNDALTVDGLLTISGSNNIDGNGGTAGQLRIGTVIVNQASLGGSNKLEVTGDFLFTGNGKITGGIEIDGSIDHDGSAVGFYGSAPVGQQTVTGAKGGNAALGSLMTALATLGLVIDSTTA